MAPKPPSSHLQDDYLEKGLAELQEAASRMAKDYLSPVQDVNSPSSKEDVRDDWTVKLEAAQEEAAQLRDLLLVASQERRESAANIQGTINLFEGKAPPIYLSLHILELIRHIRRITEESHEMMLSLTENVMEGEFGWWFIRLSSIYSYHHRDRKRELLGAIRETRTRK